MGHDKNYTADLIDKIDSAIAEASAHSILAEAEAIVGGERASDYGDAVANMKRIGQIAMLMLDPDEKADLAFGAFPATVVAKVLLAVKLGREAFTHKRDNLVDACGYLEILNRCREAKK